MFPILDSSPNVIVPSTLQGLLLLAFVRGPQGIPCAYLGSRRGLGRGRLGLRHGSTSLRAPLHSLWSSPTLPFKLRFDSLFTPLRTLLLLPSEPPLAPLLDLLSSTSHPPLLPFATFQAPLHHKLSSDGFTPFRAPLLPLLERKLRFRCVMSSLFEALSSPLHDRSPVSTSAGRYSARGPMGRVSTRATTVLSCSS